MVKTRAKGRRAVKEFMDNMNLCGWICDTVEKTGKFVKQKDLFGLWDVVCVKGKRVKFVQITCNRYHYPLKPFTDWAKEHGSYYVSCEAYKRIDGKGRSKKPVWEWKVFNVIEDYEMGVDYGKGKDKTVVVEE